MSTIILNRIVLSMEDEIAVWFEMLSEPDDLVQTIWDV